MFGAPSPNQPIRVPTNLDSPTIARFSSGPTADAIPLFSNSTLSTFLPPNRLNYFLSISFSPLLVFLSSLLSSPLLVLSVGSHHVFQDDASEIVKRRFARFPIPKTYYLGKTVIYVVVCGRKQFAPPLFSPETRTEYCNGNGFVSSITNPLDAD